MSYKQRPYKVTDGGTGSSTASGARTNLAVPLNTNTMLLDGTQAMTANMQLGTNRITGVGDPSGAQDAATKAYVDATSQGLSAKGSCRVATTGSNISLGAAPNTLDGVSLALNDRILVKDQSTGSQNGLYYVTTLGSGANGVWTRTTDADTSPKVTTGLFTFISEGTTNSGSGWVLVTDETITLGTTSLSFTQFSGAGEITAGAGLTKTGNVLDVGAGTGIQVNADSVQISPTYAGQATISLVGTVTGGIYNATKIDIPYGGTNATTASGARTNLSAAPNSASYIVASSNGELANADVATQGTGITIVSGANVTTFSVDTTVVATTSNALSMSNKTLTSPTINTPKVTHTLSTKTTNYTLVLTDDIVLFNISSGAAATLMTAASASGQIFTIKNRFDSTANVTVTPNGAEVIDTAASYVLIPGDAIDVVSDGSAWYVI